MLIEIFTHITSRDLMERSPLLGGPGQKAPNGQAIRRPGMAIGELSSKKVVPGGLSTLSRLKNDRGERLPFFLRPFDKISGFRSQN
jgi:hypothetical protein